MIDAGRKGRWWLGVVPACIFLLLLFIIPVLALVTRSFIDPDFTLRHYKRIIHNALYLSILVNTFKIAGIVTSLCLLFGYPLSYAIYRATGRWKVTLLGVVLLPFWTNLLVRTFAFLLLLQDQGSVNRALIILGLIASPLHMVHNLMGVVIGMTYMLLPYVVLPIYGVMDRIDPSLEAVARGLGASEIRAFASTTLPLSFPGILSGTGLVFLLALGFFVTPSLLGGRREQMLSMVIETQVNVTLNWGFAAALSAMLISAIVAVALLPLGARLSWVGLLKLQSLLKER